MMKKFEAHPQKSHLLKVQYRMNEKIMLWSSEQVYNSELVADESVAHHQIGITFPILVFMDTHGCGMGESLG